MVSHSAAEEPTAWKHCCARRKCSLEADWDCPMDACTTPAQHTLFHKVSHKVFASLTAANMKLPAMQM